jgi:glycyl-tRNA synthetase
MEKTNNLMDKIVSLCKRRGYIFQSSEIYGGINSCYDYGPLGVELKRNIKELWWNAMTLERDDIEGIDASILMHPKVWQASGHVEGFTDPLVDCKNCKSRFRADEITADICPKCGGTLTEIRKFNLMFKTFMGPVEDESSIVYLRPETAQGIYVNFINVQTTARRKIPFGIAQIGKAFRNEITPGNFTFRTREFEQMEMQYFIHPSEDKKWLEHWKEARFNWYEDLGLHMNKLRFHQHSPEELAHYAKEAWDIQYEFPFGWQELEGIHNRTDFDLSRHQQESNKRLSYFDETTNTHYIPYIIETSAGCDRTLLTIIVDAYDEEPERVVLRLHPRVSPIKVAILPLVNRDGMPEKARAIYEFVRKRFKSFYDDSGAIGRRYRRQDEIGTPFAITIDSQTMEDNTVTIRYRDSMLQERIDADKILMVLEEKLGC